MPSIVKGVATVALWVLNAPMVLFKALFFPPQPESPKRPVGYWWQDKKGQWHPRVYMMRKGEKPPS